MLLIRLTRPPIIILGGCCWLTAAFWDRITNADGPLIEGAHRRIMFIFFSPCSVLALFSLLNKSVVTKTHYCVVGRMALISGHPVKLYQQDKLNLLLYFHVSIPFGIFTHQSNQSNGKLSKNNQTQLNHHSRHFV